MNFHPVLIIGIATITMLIMMIINNINNDNGTVNERMIMIMP